MSEINTEAYFDNIFIKLYEEILNAEKSIFLAIAWITDEKLFNLLVNKSLSGCVIKLFVRNDSMNSNSKINFQILSNGQSQVFMIDGLHDKICIIDYKIIITGSYNWTNNAKLNHENIQITRNDFKLISKYFKEKFDVLTNLCKEDTANFELITPLNRILNRLKILKNYVSDKDCENISFEINLLSTLSRDSDLEKIKELVLKYDLNYTLQELEKYNHYSDIIFLGDSELFEIKKEIKELQDKLIALENEKNDIEKTLSEFQCRHTTEVGQIILDILKCNKLKFKTDELGYDEAKLKEENYKSLYDKQKKKASFTLSEVEQKKLKQLFRKASKLCHPDKIDSNYKELAQEIFNKLKIAYDNNDLSTITSIIEELESGNLIQENIDVLSEKNSIYSFWRHLKVSIVKLETYISGIKASETYQNLIEIDDWDLYFENLRKELTEKLSTLHSELMIS
jgi:hypothetical protein